MSENQIAVFQNKSKTLIIKIILLFSVFIFTGINTDIQAFTLQSFATELVDKRECTPIFILHQLQNDQDFKRSNSSSCFIDLLFSEWSSINGHDVLKVKVIALQSKLINCNNISIIVPYNIPVSSSDDENSYTSFS